MPGSWLGGVAKTPSGRHVFASVSSKCLSCTTATKLQAMEVAERLSKEAVAKQLNVETKKFASGASKTILCLRSTNNGVHISEEEQTDNGECPDTVDL